MRWLGTCVLVLSLAFSGHSESRRNPLFVSTQWLADHVQDPGLVVLHVGFSRPEYRLGHIPGARFLWYDWLAISTPDASTEMPGLAQADSVLEMLGISDSSTIVLCFTGSNLTTTTRMLLALTYVGFGDRTSVLDGGLGDVHPRADRGAAGGDDGGDDEALHAGLPKARAKSSSPRSMRARAPSKAGRGWR